LKRINHTAAAAGYGVDGPWIWNSTFGLEKTFEENHNQGIQTLTTTLEILGKDKMELFGLHGRTLEKSWFITPSDYYYIPAKHRSTFIGLSMHFVHQRVMCELAVANIFGILTDGDRTQYMWTEGIWLWNPDRHITAHCGAFQARVLVAGGIGCMQSSNHNMAGR
jgi:hypothetical protein